MSGARRLPTEPGGLIDTHIRLPPDLYHQLSTHCRRRRLSLNLAVNEAIRAMLELRLDVEVDK